ncbi:hypothetical protein D3C84_1181500 [compost metagenome]
MAGQGADTAGRSVEQNGFAALEFVGLAQQVLHGQALEHHACGLFKTDRVWQKHQIGLGQYMNVAVDT